MSQPPSVPGWTPPGNTPSQPPTSGGWGSQPTPAGPPAPPPTAAPLPPTPQPAAPQPPTPQPANRPLWKQPKAWGIGIVVLLVLSAIGSLGSGGSDPAAGTGKLAITSHATGDTVAEPMITVKGTAPSGSRVVRDISFGGDQEATAGADGAWSMLIELEEGANELVFRIGDDRSTELRLGIAYTPAAAASVPAPTDAVVESPSTDASAEPSEVPSEAPTAEPTAQPTTEPTPEPTPAPTFATFDDGTWLVGDEIRAGTYRTREPVSSCYWARLRGFDGSLDDIIANDNVFGYAVVTITSDDAGFESSGCGTWSKDLSQVTESRTRFGEGTFIVGTDLRPGTYVSKGGDGCYWARLKNFKGTLSSIIANDLPSGRAVVTIKSTDKGFESTGCADWVRR